MGRIPSYGPKEQRFLDRIYSGTMIDYRHSVIADYHREPREYTFFSQTPSLLPEPHVAQRNDLFVEHARELSREATERLLTESPEIDPESITHLITVTCTGFSAPGFDYHLITELGISPTVHRYHIGFMGCYAGFPALKLAHTICAAERTARVLIVDVELCSLHVQFKNEPDTMVANAIFADGAAAAVVSAEPPSRGPALELRSFSTRVIPGSDEAMTWQLGTTAFDMRLSAYVPRLIEQNIADIVDRTMEPLGLSRSAVDLWAIHPGGRAILDRAAQSLALREGALDASFAVLRQYGNMSSATIFFVLQELLQREGRGTVFAAAFGPGLTVESAHLHLGDIAQ